MPLCLTKHHAMKTYWVVDEQLRAFSTSALNGGKWSASCPGRSVPGEEAPGSGEEKNSMLPTGIEP